MSKKVPAISRILLLNKAFFCLYMHIQNLNMNYNSQKYLDNAESIIEILESLDCGSHGGYDDKNPLVSVTKFKLFDRFLTLVRKYNQFSLIEPHCGYSLADIAYCFSKHGKDARKHAPSDFKVS